MTNWSIEHPVDALFGRAFCINLQRSVDRWEHVQRECEKHGILSLERFDAYDLDHYKDLPLNLKDGFKNAMYGCTASHGALLHRIGNDPHFENALVLEDDFEILHDDFNQRLNDVMPFIPKDFDILYLGAGYGEPPISRVNEHVIRVAGMKTTSSYVITRKHARFIAPFVCGGSGPDDLISGFNHISKAYCLQVRLMGQYENVSTIWGKLTHNSQSMTDTYHQSLV